MITVSSSPPAPFQNPPQLCDYQEIHIKRVEYIKLAISSVTLACSYKTKKMELKQEICSFRGDKCKIRNKK